MREDDEVELAWRLNQEFFVGNFFMSFRETRRERAMRWLGRVAQPRLRWLPRWLSCSATPRNDPFRGRYEVRCMRLRGWHRIHEWAHDNGATCTSWGDGD